MSLEFGITAVIGARPPVRSSHHHGLHRLAGVEVPFPVLDWNGIALKDLIHNRHHVGAETSPAFTAITGLSMYGREIVVVGFGPVGQGVALRARDLGANVTVVDLDPVSPDPGAAPRLPRGRLRSRRAWSQRDRHRDRFR